MLEKVWLYFVIGHLHALASILPRSWIHSTLCSQKEYASLILCFIICLYNKHLEYFKEEIKNTYSQITFDLWKYGTITLDYLTHKISQVNKINVITNKIWVLKCVITFYNRIPLPVPVPVLVSTSIDRCLPRRNS